MDGIWPCKIMTCVKARFQDLIGPIYHDKNTKPIKREPDLK